MNEPKVILKYIGKGAWLPDVPARDLTEVDFSERSEDWREVGWDENSLVGSGLYEYAIESSKPKKKKDGE